MRTTTALKVATTTLDPARLAGLSGLAQSLGERGRHQDARLLLEHLDALQPGNVETLKQIVRAMGAEGQTLQAVEKLVALKAVMTDIEALVGEIRVQMPAAITRFNAHLAAGQVVEADRYAAALAALVPGNPALINAALSCSLALGHKDAAQAYAIALVRLDPAHETARAVLAEAGLAAAPVEQRAVVAAAPAVSEAHPLIQLRDLHDAASKILCGPLDESALSEAERLLTAARGIVVDVPPGSEWEGWAKHYRLAVDALDLAFMTAATPAPAKDEAIVFASAAGAALDWAGVQAQAKRLGARTVFFAAADRAYVDLYAGWYVKSILKYCDVKALIVVHVIGGAGELKDVAKAIGIKDERLVFAGDRFAADKVETKCYDTPPKCLIAKPVAHLQSVRFLRLGALLQKLKLPVFVSDIDLILQRGVEDLLARCKGADVVFNENTGNTNAGSRLTANLLLVNPTDNAALFLRFLKAYLERALSGREVSRWIDQFALLMGRHHLSRRGKAPRIEYFDTASDINNVMYRSYQEHPFRFLSLYHGFDTSSLEANPSVLGGEAVGKIAKPAGKGAKTAKPKTKGKAKR
jgi:hypothetical protein